MTEAEFKALAAQGYNRIPMVLETFADLDTPLSVYLKLANKSYSYLLESVQGGERFGRYSFIGLPAATRIEVSRRPYQRIDDSERQEIEAADPLAFFRILLVTLQGFAVAGLARFCGGLVGYFGYDMVRYIETETRRPRRHPDTLDTPDILLLLSEELAVVDNLPANSSLSSMPIQAWMTPIPQR